MARRDRSPADRRPPPAPAVVQLTAATYRNPQHVPRGRVLVAGDGATGRQIALGFAGDREVLLATRRRRVVTAQRILGRDQLWWSDRLGLLRASRDSAVGRLVRKLDAFPGEQLRLGALRRRGVRVVRRLRSVRGTSAHSHDWRVAIVLLPAYGAVRAFHAEDAVSCVGGDPALHPA